MNVLVIHTIAGRLDRLQAVLDQHSTADIGAIFVLGNLVAAPDVAASTSPKETVVSSHTYATMLDALGARGVPVYLIPGPYDTSVADLKRAVNAYRGTAAIQVVHRAVASLGTSDAIAGFGGHLTTTDTHVSVPIHVSAWEARVALEHLAAYDHLFRTSQRRILLFATPPRGERIDRHGDTHVGVPLLNTLIRTYQPHLVCCAGPPACRGVERIDGTPVVNPGALRDGAYAIIDLDHMRVDLERLIDPLPPATGAVRKIVVALDGSAPAWRALEQAAGIARAFGAQVTLVHALAPVRDALGEPYLSEAIGQRMGRAEHVLEVPAQYLADLAPQCEVLEWPPADAIVRVADTQRADLIVMGTRGTGGIHRLLGSVSSRVVERANCPILLAHHPPNTLALRERSSMGGEATV